MKGDRKHGKIELSGLFEASAQRLILAVQQGRILHSTKNIRDSGLPFETEFRSFLGSRLPSPFRVMTGYLFDPKANCTPQIDAVVIDERESHELMRSDDGASYVPYPSGRIICEIKNSCRGLAKHVRQLSAICTAVENMRVDARRIRLTSEIGVVNPEPMSLLIIGDTAGAKLSAFCKAFGDRSLQPTFTLLLDRGFLIARRSIMEQFYSQNQSVPILDFYGKVEQGAWAIWEPEKPERKSGRALLWVYFAILAQLNLMSRSNTGSIIDFTNQVARDFPMRLRAELKQAKTW